jgi:hypothetical protein
MLWFWWISYQHSVGVKNLDVFMDFLSTLGSCEKSWFFYGFLVKTRMVRCNNTLWFSVYMVVMSRRLHDKNLVILLDLWWTHTVVCNSVLWFRRISDQYIVLLKNRWYFMDFLSMYSFSENNVRYFILRVVITL